MADLSAQTVIELLGLRPHPEGGHYVETFRDPVIIDGRAASTAIYFLWKPGSGRAGTGSTRARSGIGMRARRSLSELLLPMARRQWCVWGRTC